MIYERLKLDLRAAMKGRDSEVVRVLRILIGALDNAGAIDAEDAPLVFGGPNGDVPRRQLTREDEIRVLDREASELKGAIAQFLAAGRPAEAERLRRQLGIVELYLP